MLSFLKLLIDFAKNLVEAGLEFLEKFKEEYNDLENSETKIFIERICLAVSSSNIACFS